MITCSVRTRKKFLLFLCVVLCFYGGGVFAGGKQEKPPTDGTGKADTNKNTLSGRSHFIDKVVPEYAEGFSVEYHDTYKVVDVFRPWQGASEDFRYILLQRGTEAPDGYGDAQVVEIPVNRIITMSTTYVTYLDMLDEMDSLVGHESFLYTMNEKLLRMVEEGKVKETGSGPQLNIEVVLELDADVILTHAIGGEWDTHPKLFEAGQSVVFNGEYMEGTPLGRFEWIKFISLFYNKEKQANQIFDKTAEAYTELAEKAGNPEDRPGVLVNSPYQGTWWVPGGNSFQARFIKDAGGAYIWGEDDSEGALMLDIEAVYEKAADADVWINPGMWSSLEEAKAEDERFAEFKAYKEREIYNNNRMENKNGGNAYWEFGLAEPHIVLADLIKIFHPDLVPDHEFVYYHRLK